MTLRFFKQLWSKNTITPSVDDLKYLIMNLSCQLTSEILFEIKFNGIQFCNLSFEKASNQVLFSETRTCFLFEVKKFAFNHKFLSIASFQAD